MKSTMKTFLADKTAAIMSLRLKCVVPADVAIK
jgi:hypothetical protein